MALISALMPASTNATNSVGSPYDRQDPRAGLHEVEVRRLLP